MKKVSDMYGYARANNLKLLSDYTADFWAEYKANSDRYDKLFNRFFTSYRYFMQKHDETLEEITTNFIEDVYNHLLINTKRYSELYRIHVVSDEDYSIIDNYNITEQMGKLTSDKVGARIDGGTNTYGAQTNTSTGEVAPYDTEVFSNDRKTTDSIGGRNDGYTFNLGEQNNSGTEDYTLTRKGNIGVMTATDIMKKHKDFWTAEAFYTMIFKNICAELLLV